MPSLPSNIQQIQGLPTYGYDPVSEVYYDLGTGQSVDWDVVRQELDSLIAQSESEAQSVSDMLREGTIGLSDWQMQMMTLVKVSHVAAAVLAVGGFAQMTQATYGAIGQIVRGEYGLLRNFARQIANGKQKLDGTLARRASLYLQQLRPTYYKITRFWLRQKGFDEERSLLTPADHCTSGDGSRGGCVEEQAKGWQPIGDMIQIGGRNCHGNCKCQVQYRKSETGQVTKR